MTAWELRHLRRLGGHKSSFRSCLFETSLTCHEPAPFYSKYIYVYSKDFVFLLLLFLFIWRVCVCVLTLGICDTLGPTPTPKFQVPWRRQAAVVLFTPGDADRPDSFVLLKLTTTYLFKTWRLTSPYRVKKTPNTHREAQRELNALSGNHRRATRFNSGKRNHAE